MGRWTRRASTVWLASGMAWLALDARGGEPSAPGPAGAPGAEAEAGAAEEPGEASPAEKPRRRSRRNRERFRDADVVANFDTDGDGHLDRRERRAARAAGALGSGGGRGRARRDVRRYDLDGDGDFRPVEIEALSEEMSLRGAQGSATRPGRRLRDREDVVKGADTDGDGRASFQERQAVREERMRARYDVNGDGRIDAQERDWIRKRKRILPANREGAASEDPPETAAAEEEPDGSPPLPDPGS